MYSLHTRKRMNGLRWKRMQCSLLAPLFPLRAAMSAAMTGSPPPPRPCNHMVTYLFVLCICFVVCVSGLKGVCMHLSVVCVYASFFLFPRSLSLSPHTRTHTPQHTHTHTHTTHTTHKPTQNTQQSWRPMRRQHFQQRWLCVKRKQEVVERRSSVKFSNVSARCQYLYFCLESKQEMHRV